jgi:hypothetical protein
MFYVDDGLVAAKTVAEADALVDLDNQAAQPWPNAGF